MRLVSTSSRRAVLLQRCEEWKQIQLILGPVVAPLHSDDFALHLNGEMKMK